MFCLNKHSIAVKFNVCYVLKKLIQRNCDGFLLYKFVQGQFGVLISAYLVRDDGKESYENGMIEKMLSTCFVEPTPLLISFVVTVMTGLNEPNSSKYIVSS